MQKLLTVFAVLFYSFHSFGQATENLAADTLRVRQILKDCKTRPGTDAVARLENARQILIKNDYSESIIMSDVLHLMATFLGTGTPRRLPEAIEKLEVVIRLRRKFLGTENMELARSLNNLGEYLTDSDPQRALKLHRESLAIRLKNRPEDHPDVATAYVQLGKTYMVFGDLPEAEKWVKMALEIRLKKFGASDAKTKAAMNNLGRIYFYKHDYEKAIEIFEKGIADDEKSSSASIARNNLANCYNFIGQPDRAIACAEKILAGDPGVLKDVVFQQKIQRIFGNAYLLKAEFGRAAPFFEKIMVLENPAPGNESLDFCQALKDLGRCLVSEQKHAEALTIQHRALDILKNKFPERRIERSATYNALGETYHQMKRYEEAIFYFSKAKEANLSLHGAFHPSLQSVYTQQARTQAEMGDFKASLAVLDTAFLCSEASQHSEKPLALLRLIGAKLFVFKLLATKDSSQRTLDLVSETVDQCLAVFKMLEKQQVSDEFFSEMQQNQREVLEKTFTLLAWLNEKCPDAYNLQRGWELSERAKSQALTATYHKSRAKKIAGVPDSILEKERQIRINLAYWEILKSQKLDEKLSENDSTVLVIAAKIFDLKNQAEQFNRTLEHDFPEYLRLKYGRPPLKIEAVQANLPADDQTAVVSFALTETGAVAFVVSKKSARMFSLNCAIEDSIQTLMRSLTAYFQAPPSVQTLQLKAIADAQYLRTARYLYDKIMLPMAADLRPKLLILPDGVLNLLPFEALVSVNPARPDRFHTYEYLVKKYDIRYSWSATLQYELESQPKSPRRTQAQKSLLGMAPFAHADTTFLNGLEFVGTRGFKKISPREWSPLPFSAAEISAAQAVLGGESKFDTAATRQFFIENAPNFPILMLATHADANPNYDALNWIAFAPQSGSPENSLLFSGDIYNLKLDADLILLSGCNTGTGRLRRSEGVMSLGRAFVGAGARAVVSTFWKVSDAGTERLMRHVFQNLKSGKTKSEALQQAKQTLFAPPSEAEQARYQKLGVDWTRFSHPFFWAGFALWGDVSPLR